MSGPAGTLCVVGGGAAGLRAALFARQRGHEVTLFEREAVLVASAGNQEIRIGKVIILKTEYMEFDPAIVTAVEIEPIYQELGA